MNVRDHDELPKDLRRGRSRFQAWRSRRMPGSRIPRPLWALAVRLANLHGISRTADVLGVDYYRLKKQAQETAEQAPSNGPAFVELPAPVAIGKQCLLELDNGAGASMRVQLVGYDAAEVAALAGNFWNAE
jgi:hypothetical protein